jgi:protein TonB
MELKKHPSADLKKNRFTYFLLGLVIALSLTLVAFEWKTYDYPAPELERDVIIETEEEIIPITFVNKAVPPPPPPPKPVIEDVIKVVDNTVPEIIEVEKTPVVTEPLDVDIPEPEEKFEEPNFFTVVEEMPVFPGCETAGSPTEIADCSNLKMYKYIIENTTYPAIAKDAGISGVVVVQYIINASGKVEDVEILHGVVNGNALEKEAIRVVSSLPVMKPGKQRGSPVRVQYRVPVKFNLK